MEETWSVKLPDIDVVLFYDRRFELEEGISIVKSSNFTDWLRDFPLEDNEETRQFLTHLIACVQGSRERLWRKECQESYYRDRYERDYLYTKVLHILSEQLDKFSDNKVNA